MANKPEIYIGLKFGQLTVESILPHKNKHNQSLCIAICECGISKQYVMGWLVSGNTKSCGHSKPVIDRSVKRYGRLTITKFSKERDQENKELCNVICDCGNEFKARIESIRSGNTSSCGCSGVTNHKAFDDKDSSFMYWAGFIAADGCIVSKDKRIEIGLHSKDADHLRMFSFIVHDSDRVRVNENYCCVSVHSERIRTLFAGVNITPRKSLTFDPHDSCVDSIDFWRGMVDGDGSLSWKILRKEKKLYLCGSLQTCIKFIEFAKRNNINGYLKNDGNIYRANFHCSSALKNGNTAIRQSTRIFLKKKI